MMVEPLQSVPLPSSGSEASQAATGDLGSLFRDQETSIDEQPSGSKEPLVAEKEDEQTPLSLVSFQQRSSYSSSKDSFPHTEKEGETLSSEFASLKELLISTDLQQLGRANESAMEEPSPAAVDEALTLLKDSTDLGFSGILDSGLKDEYVTAGMVAASASSRFGEN